jgi:hypothetical protein
MTMSDYAMTMKVVDMVNKFRGEWPKGYAVIYGVDEKAFTLCAHEMEAGLFVKPASCGLAPETDKERRLVDAMLAKMRGQAVQIMWSDGEFHDSREPMIWLECEYRLLNE